MSARELEGRVALITGASAGIGRATAQWFVDHGAVAVNVDLRKPEETLPGCRFIRADVSDFEAAGTCVEGVLDEEGRIDVLVNNAGVSRDAAVWNMSEEQWDTVLRVHLKGAFNYIHHTAPHFRERNAGSIVNVSSINGLRGKFGLANYSAAKAGLIGLTKTTARELGRHHVTVNAVAPGLILTELTSALPQRFLDEAEGEAVTGRLGTAQDVAGVIGFLCSDAARHVTGEVIRVDGGQYI